MKMKKLKFSQKEIYDILKGWIGISIAFGILLFGVVQNKLYAFLLALFTVGVGFLLHELGHKFVAQKYKCWAEFRSFDQMIIIAIITAFLGVVFAAPGAVMIRGHITNEKYGKIAAAGPIINYILAILFLISQLVYPNLVSLYGFIINAWLGLFNMLPFGMFDGAKILRWNKGIYSVMVGFGVILLIIQQFMVVI